MLNSPFVIDQAGKWAKSLIHDRADDSAERRIRRMFAAAFGRAPVAEELAASSRYVTALATDRSLAADKALASEPVWQDFAQSLFNLKEFIYVR
jgi:hypothetical protein